MLQGYKRPNRANIHRQPTQMGQDHNVEQNNPPIWGQLGQAYLVESQKPTKEGMKGEPHAYLKQVGIKIDFPIISFSNRLVKKG